MSTILYDGRPAAQNPGKNTSSQICDKKVSCANAMNDDLATLKNEMKQLRKEMAMVYWFVAILVIITAVLVASMAFTRLPFTNTYESPKNCLATGRGLEMTVVGERANAVLHTVESADVSGSIQMETVACELVSESSGTKVDCNVRKVMENQYEVSYQATSRGRHQLHIKVEGEHIKGSPFPVTVKLPVQKLGTPIKAIRGLNWPWGVAVNKRGEILVAEIYMHRISVFSPTGVKLRSFGSEGSGPGQFKQPCSVIVDDDGNILVVDAGNRRIEKFTSDYKHIASASVESQGLQYSHQIAVTISTPFTRKIAISDSSNNHVQIFNPDLTFNSSIHYEGESLKDIAFDSAGNMYMADSKDNCIRVFNPKYNYTNMRQFGKRDKNYRELLDGPICIYIDSDNIVYVTEENSHRISLFTLEGEFLTSFGSKGDGPGQFNRPYSITMDKQGMIYVVDRDNARIQVFAKPIKTQY